MINGTENLLKRSLKRRVEITTATIVGFLIMGTVVFSEIVKEDNISTIGGNQKISVLTSKDNQIKTVDGKFNNGQIEVKNQNYQVEGVKNININLTGKRETDRVFNAMNNGKVTLLQGGEIINTTESTSTQNIAVRVAGQSAFPSSETATRKDFNLEFINNGKVKSNHIGILASTGVAPYGGNFTNIFEKMKIENNGDVLFGSKFDDAIGIKISGDKQQNGSINNEFTAEVINNGTIISNGTISGKNISGIEATGNVKIENNKDITVKGNGQNIIGIEYRYSRTNENNAKITNTGKIDVSGEDAYGIFAEKTENNSSSNKVHILNDTAGQIIVNGKNAVGVKLVGDGSSFTNQGIITLGKDTINGAGIVANKGAIVTNEGTIELALEDKNGKETDNVAIIIKGNGSATNSGTIKVTDKTAAELEKSGFDIKSLFNGTKHTEVTNTGMVVGSDDKAVTNEESIYLDDNSLTAEIINKEGKEKNSITLGKLSLEENMRNDKTTIKTGQETINTKSLNIIGKVWIGDETVKKQNIKIGAENINLDKNGIFTIHEGNKLTIIGSTLNKHGEDKKAIVVGKGTELNLQDATILSGDIVGDTNGKGSGNVNLTGNNILNGNIHVKNIAVNNGESRIGGKVEFANMTTALNSKAIFSKDSILGNGDSKKITSNGMTVFEIGSKGENALSNALGSVTITGNIDFDTKNLTKDTEIDLDNTALNKEHNLVNAEYKNKTDGVYITNLNKDTNVLSFAYNKNLFDDDRLNDINNEMQIVGGVTENVTEREKLVENIYSANIYSETVKAFYDNLKLNEDTILSLGKKAKVGELKTHGKVLYSKDEYTRKGIKNNFDADVETSGMLAGVEYGISNSTSVGTIFSGTKQKIDVTNGSADGDLFYFGVYGTKTIGKYDFITGLGYQFGKYDTNNNIISNTGDKYNSKAISGYIQGKYTTELEEGLVIQPKLKLGYTHVEQDNAKDKNFGVSDTEISVFDTEIGFDVVKSIQLDNKNLNVTFGTSYIKTMGDTDKKFTGKFYNESENKISNGFNVLGAELPENSLNFELKAEVEKENGVFYGGGFSYQLGSNDTKSYRVNLGVGYKF